MGLALCIGSVYILALHEITYICIDLHALMVMGPVAYKYKYKYKSRLHDVKVPCHLAHDIFTSGLKASVFRPMIRLHEASYVSYS